MNLTVPFFIYIVGYVLWAGFWMAQEDRSNHYTDDNFLMAFLAGLVWFFVLPVFVMRFAWGYVLDIPRRRLERAKLHAVQEAEQQRLLREAGLDL